jgi:hypothetical protein
MPMPLTTSRLRFCYRGALCRSSGDANVRHGQHTYETRLVDMTQEGVDKSYRYLYREHGEQCGAPSISSSGCILRNCAVVATRELWQARE